MRQSDYAYSAHLLGEIAMVDRRIATGREHLAEQSNRIARMEARGWDATLSRQLLVTFSSVQESHEMHHDRLARELQRHRSR